MAFTIQRDAVRRHAAIPYGRVLQCYSSPPDGSPREPNAAPAAGRGVFLGSYLLLPLQPGKEWTTHRFRQLVEAYRAGNHELAAQELLHVDRARLPGRNVEFVAGLDLERPADRARLVAAILLFTEAAVLATVPEASDFYLDQAVALTTSFDESRGTALQEDLHLAACYRLFHQRRVTGALRVVEPAAERYASELARSLDPAFGISTVDSSQLYLMADSASHGERWGELASRDRAFAPL